MALVAIGIRRRVIQRIHHQLVGDKLHTIANRPADTSHLGIAHDDVDGLGLIFVALHEHRETCHAPREVLLKSKYIAAQGFRRRRDKLVIVELIVVAKQACSLRCLE